MRGIAGFVAGVMMAGAAMAGGKHKALERSWVMAEKHAVADKALPTMTLMGGKISGTDSCNRIGGSYTLTGAHGIRFQAVSTKMACPDMRAADAFGAALEAARNFEVRGDTLFLSDERGRRVGMFRVVGM